MAENKGLKYVNIITSSVRNKTYSFAIFTLLVVIVLLVGAIRPTVITISRINKEIKEKSEINDMLDTKINNLAQLSNQDSELSDQIEMFPLIFPTQGNFSLFMANIEEIAKDNGYKLIGINFDDPDIEKDSLSALAPWSARVNITGKKSNLVKFLEDLESTPMYPDVIQVSYANQVNETGLTAFNVNVLIYRIEDPKFYE